MTDLPQPPIPPTPPGAPYPEQSQAATAGPGHPVDRALSTLGTDRLEARRRRIRAIAEGRRPPEGLGLAQAGRICGIVGSCLLGLAILLLVFSLFALLLGFGIFVTEATRS